MVDEEILVEERTIELSEPQTLVDDSVSPFVLEMAGYGAGKSFGIGYKSARFIIDYPEIKGFIAANTHQQLSQSTLSRCLQTWEDYFGFSEYDAKSNPDGNYVIDKKPPRHFKRVWRFKSYDGIISFDTGCIVFIGSLENYKAHDGKEFGWSHLDETKDTKEEAVKIVILGRLRQLGLWTDANGKIVYDTKLKPAQAKEKGLKQYTPLWIHSAPAIGEVKWLVDMFDLPKYAEKIKQDIMTPNDFYYRETDGKCVVIYSSMFNKQLPESYFEDKKRIWSESEQLKYIYGYPFSKTGGEFYGSFNRFKQMARIRPSASGVKHVTFDFNVLPYMTMLAADVFFVKKYIDKYGVKHLTPVEGSREIDVLIIAFYKEYCFKQPVNTTEAICKAFLEDNVGNPNLQIFVYGDASGRNRIEGLGSVTNYKLIEQYFTGYLYEGWNRVPKQNMGLSVRRSLMNRIFEGKIPEVEVYFDTEMIETARDFEFVKQAADGGKLKEKETDPETKVSYEKIGHTSDGADYLVCEIVKKYMNIQF